MGAGSGFALKFFQWFNRGVQFCCSGLILAIFSYFLATLNSHNIEIATWVRAVEGISGAGALYSAIGLLLLCCLAGLTITSFLAIALDVAFVGAFIYIASATRAGAGTCNGRVDTPFGAGESDSQPGDNLPTLRTVCKLETACFSVAIVAIFFFIFSALVEFALARHHQKAKRFGPSPANDYTSGYGKSTGGGGGLLGRWLSRKSARTSTNPNGLPEHTHPDAVRTSYATETTAVPPQDELNMHGHNKHPHAGGRLSYEEPVSPVSPVTAHYPAGNYRYDDGVYSTRA